MYIILFSSLFLLWLALCSKLTWDVIVIGLLLSYTITYLSIKYVFFNHRPKFLFNKLYWFAKYIVVLFVEVVLANIEMIRIVLNEPVEKENPSIGFFRSNLQSDYTKTMLAHAITLTPGTITVEINQDLFYVTAMNPDMLSGIDESSFIDILHHIEA